MTDTAAPRTPTPIDPIVSTLTLMRRQGVEMRQVPGHQPGFTLPVPATMPPATWWGLLQLAIEPDFMKLGGFTPEARRRIATEHAHWAHLDKENAR